VFFVGDDLAMDVGAVFHDERFIKFNISFLGYGYYGDCIADSESSRWMGPKRYDWAGKPSSYYLLYNLNFWSSYFSD